MHNTHTNTDDSRAPFLKVADPKSATGLRIAWVNPVLARHILKVAMPVVLGMVTQTAINILDGAMVGRLPKAEANPGQAAIGLALPFMWLVGGFLSAIWVGTQALTSRRAGAGLPREAGKVLTNSLAIAVTSCLVLSAAAIIVTPWLIQLLYGGDPALVAYAVQYLQVRYLGILAMVATFSYKSFFDGLGKTHLFMVAAITMNILNVVLNYWLIFGYDALGIPKLGVTGAAWASVISAYVGLFILIAWSFAPSFHQRYGYYKVANFNKPMLWHIIRLSLPNGAATIVVMIGFSAFYWVVGQVNAIHAPVGNPFIATANQVIIMAAMPSFMTSLAFGTATASIVSQALGAQRKWLAQRYAKEALKLWSYVMMALGLVLMLMPNIILKTFTLDPQVIETARTPLMAMGAAHGVIAVAVILAQILYGLGDAKYVMLIELCSHLFVMAPIAYLFGVVLDWGFLGVYMGPGLYVLVLATSMVWRFTKGKWLDLEI